MTSSRDVLASRAMTRSRGKILVTGGLGNLGLSTLSYLMREGFDVRFLDLPTRANRVRAARLPKAVERAFGDVTSAKDVADAVHGVTGIVHLAALLPPTSERFGELAHRVNVAGTTRLVEAARIEKMRGPFVLASSCTVYGPAAADGRLAKVTDPTVGTDNYTRSKVEAEAIVRAAAPSPTIMRVGVAIEGARSAADPIVMRQLFEVAPDNPIELVHGEDVALAIANAVAREAAHGGTWNLGGGPSCRVTQRDLFRALERTMRLDPLPDAAFGRAPYYTCFMDTAESERVLTFQRHDYEAIVRDLGARVTLLGPLLRLVSPITRRALLRYSGPYNGEPPRPTWADLIAAEPRA